MTKGARGHMSISVGDLSIKISPRNGEGYKSIVELSWDDIPGFAILTGRNGSGKTQLLEVLAYYFSGALPRNTRQGQALPVEIVVDGVKYRPEQIAYVPSGGRFSGGSPASLASIPQVRQQVLQNVQNAPGNINDITATIKAKRVIALLKGKLGHSLTPDELKEIFPDDFEFMLDDVDVTAGLTYVFLAYHLKSLESLERWTPGLTKEGQPLGPAPWDVVNQSLSVAGFPYEVVPPTEFPLMDQYELKLRDRSSRNQIGALDLSSGEKVLLQLILWLYSSGKEGVFPKLLLLDEPDAHLHPSMTTQFLDVISEVLVNKHGIRVIMTTHSPSTVALAPEGSIFQIERGAKIVEKVAHRQDVISILTAGLVTVSRTTRFCFVEDEDDVTFYEAVHEILTNYGDPMALKTSPSIAFIAASVGSGATKVSGGNTIVEKWVAKLDAEPLDRTFVGLVDRDASNAAKGRIYVIGRYSFENYLLDPFNIYCCLMEEGASLSISDLQLTTGDEHLLRIQPQNVLQTIADQITTRMESYDPKIKTPGKSSVAYTIGLQVIVPSWVIDYRGHDLLPIAQGAFGGTRIVSPPRLIKALRRGRLIPSELASLLAKIQSG